MNMTWRTAYLETRVMSADPVQLIGILYEYGVLTVQEAREHLRSRDIPARAKAISKAIAIVSELESSLDHKAGGEIADNLGRLYQYIREKLLQANIEQSDALLAEVEGLMNTLAEGWDAVLADSRSTHSVAVTATNPMPWGPASGAEVLSEYTAHSWSA